MPLASSTRNCWIAGAGLGVLVWLLTAGAGSLAWFEGLVLGVVAAWLLGSLLIWLLFRGEPAMDSSHWQPRPVSPGPAIADAAPLAVTQVEPAGQDIAVPAAAPEAGAAEAPETDAVADDLKQIKGIGPKLEDLLHAHGITRFAQIAAWDDAEMDRFAEVIGRMGSRIRSDDWVGQARSLAAGTAA